MTNQRLEEYFERLKMETLFLNEKLAILRFLKEERWKHPEYKKTTHLSGAFFHFVEQALQTDIIVTLDKLYDEKGERSLIKYLSQVEMHLSKIFDRKEIQSQINEIKNADALLKKISINRNKFYAHYDIKYFDNPAKLIEDAPLSLEELSNLVELTKKIIRKHHLVFHQSDFLFIELHDTQAIFNVASGYINYLLMLEEQDINNMRMKRAIG